MEYLLDTNVLSELRKRHPHPHVAAWVSAVPDRTLFLSTMVIGEIRRGVELLRRRDIPRAERLEDWLGQVVNQYAERILPVTTEVADSWGRLNCPDRLPGVDGLLAATALVHDLTLVTRNVKDVERTGVRVWNPFHG